MDNRFYVYQYCYPDGTPYYIGKGSGRRKRVHLCDAHAGRNTEKYAVRVTAKLLRNGQEPIIEVVQDNMFERDALDLEIELIAKHGRRDIGTGILTNQTDGGDRGVSNPSDEVKAKQVKKFVEWSRNERVVDEEYRKKISQGLKAYRAEHPYSDDQRKLLSDKMTGERNHFYGKTHSDEVKKKLSESRLGKPLSDEHKNSIANAMRGKHSGEENPFHGMKHTDETRAKMSDSQRKRLEKMKADGVPHWNAGRKRSKDNKLSVEVTCPHCGKVGRGGAMKRYHFDNCKHRAVS